MEYRFAHVGIHNDTADACSENVQKLCDAFGFRSFDLGNSVIVEGPMEWTKSRIKNAPGHIGIECDDVSAGIADLKSKGIEVDESTTVYAEDGSIQSVYLKELFGSFSCHLLKKRCL